MSIRSESIPYRGELSYQLQDLLRRNGMKAQLVVEQDQYKLGFHTISAEKVL